MEQLAVDTAADEAADKVRENKARRAVERRRYSLRKSRRRDDRAPDFGRYCIIDPTRNAYVAGGSPWSHSMTLEDVEAWLED